VPAQEEYLRLSVSLRHVLEKAVNVFRAAPPNKRFQATFSLRSAA
jgi:hypothetical protein